MAIHRRSYCIASVLVLAAGEIGCAAMANCKSEACADDAKITAAVQQQLDHDLQWRAPNVINVQTVDHVVYLSGSVDTAAKKSQAISVARDTKGVDRVVDSIGFDNP